LEFDTAKITANSGDEVTVTFSNPSTINSHNFVIVQDGTKDAVAADGTIAGQDNHWVQPGDSRVIANTVLIGPGGETEVKFTAPAPGTYQFVCTFPGHNLTMFGEFVVNQAAESTTQATGESSETETSVAAESTTQATGESSETETSVAAGPVAIAIGAAGDGLAFDATNLSANSGDEVTVTFSNPSSFNSHNFVVVQDGTKDAVAADGIAWPNDNWVPPGDSRIIAKTVLIGPGESTDMTFTAPAPGTYQFVCTFPGHSSTMFGDFVVN
jgi:azurin